jgi:hypothetical protein
MFGCANRRQSRHFDSIRLALTLAGYVLVQLLKRNYLRSIDLYERWEDWLFGKREHEENIRVILCE